MNQTDTGKRKLEETETSSSDDDEDNLFVPQAREVFAQVKKIRAPRQVPLNLLGNDTKDAEEEDIDENLEDEELTEDEIEEPTEGAVSGDSEEEWEDDEEEITENQGDTIEELAAGREEKEDDDIIVAITNAAKPQEKTKPPDLRSSCMVTDVSFHPNKELVAISNIEGEITCYRYGIEENELLHTLNHHKKSCRVLTFSQDGALLYSASKDKSVVMVDTETMKVTQSFHKAHGSPIYSLLCMDANIWASGDDDGVVKVWDRRRSTQKPVVEFTKEIDEFVSCMITDSGNRLLVCTSGEGTLTAFNTRAKKMDGQSEVYPSEMNCAGLIRQETKVLAGLGNGNMYIFDWKSFGYHSDAFGDHPSAINCMLPIMDNIVITGCDDGKIRAISLFPHRFLGVVGAHKFPIERLDISTCGHYVASTSHDGRVRFWNISYFEDPNLKLMESTTKKSVRNKKRSLRKEKMGFQLPSSKRRNKGDFFAGLAEPEPEPEEADKDEEDDSDDDSDNDSDENSDDSEDEIEPGAGSVSSAVIDE